MTLRHKNAIKFRLRLKPILLIAMGAGAVVFFITLISSNIGTPTIAEAATPYETMDSGSYIINTGIVPQTYNNGLKPYGMVYDLINNYNIQCKWVIDTTKTKDGKDFTYAGVDFKGGPFIIPAQFISVTVKTRITYWQTQGVVGLYTTSAVSVPVYATLTCIPKITVDNSSGREDIIENYFTNAGFPLNSFEKGLPDSLGVCHDLWINPHGDPTWASHKSLYDFAVVNGSFIWSECHATSVMEGVKNTASPFQQLNFLSTNGLKCYSSNKCLPGSTETHAGNPTTPVTLYYPGDPIMQFMGQLNLGGGSEEWFIPQSTGAWRSTTKRCAVTSDLDGNGTTAEKVAAQRVFFNYMFFASILKSIKFTTVSVPSSLASGETKNLAVTVGSGNPVYTYQWTSTVAGGSFGSGNSASTTYRAPNTGILLKGVFTCKVTDACGRKNFISKPFVIDPNALPVSLTTFTAFVNDKNKVQLNWMTVSEKDNDYFTIERSKDGKLFNEIKQVSGAGTSNVIKKYAFIDEHPVMGISYYRLKQTDYNGITTTFKTVMVSMKTVMINSIKVYPNPFKSSFTAEFESYDEQEVLMQLLNMNGKAVHAEKVMVVQGFNSIRFELNTRIAKGTYLLRLVDKKAVFALEKVSIED